jgi:hypothetical protein
MNLQYNYDNTGKPIGVFIPIDEWNKLKSKYKELAQEEPPLWQEEFLNKRLELLANNPAEVCSLDSFLIEIEAFTNEKV